LGRFAQLEARISLSRTLFQYATVASNTACVRHKDSGLARHLGAVVVVVDLVPSAREVDDVSHVY
jgi:hypothetical protein